MGNKSRKWGGFFLGLSEGFKNMSNLMSDYYRIETSKKLAEDQRKREEERYREGLKREDLLYDEEKGRWEHDREDRLNAERTRRIDMLTDKIEEKHEAAAKKEYLGVLARTEQRNKFKTNPDLRYQEWLQNPNNSAFSNLERDTFKHRYLKDAGKIDDNKKGTAAEKGQITDKDIFDAWNKMDEIGRARYGNNMGNFKNEILKQLNPPESKLNKQLQSRFLAEGGLANPNAPAPSGNFYNDSLMGIYYNPVDPTTWGRLPAGANKNLPALPEYEEIMRPGGYNPGRTDSLNWNNPGLQETVQGFNPSQYSENNQSAPYDPSVEFAALVQDYKQNPKYRKQEAAREKQDPNYLAGPKETLFNLLLKRRGQALTEAEDHQLKILLDLIGQE